MTDARQRDDFNYRPPQRSGDPIPTRALGRARVPGAGTDASYGRIPANGAVPPPDTPGMPRRPWAQPTLAYPTLQPTSAARPGGGQLGPGQLRPAPGQLRPAPGQPRPGQPGPGPGQPFGMGPPSRIPPRRPPPPGGLPVHHVRPERGRHWAAVLGLLLGAVTIGSGGVYLVRQGPGGVGACPPATLRVVASPDITPLIRTAARAITSGHCSAVSVAVQEPAETVANLRTRPPDVWVPSSTAWLRLAGADAGLYPAMGVSLARSPLVVAAPRPLAQTLGWPGRQPSWTELADKTYAHQIPRFSMADPLRTTAGLLAVLGVETAAARAENNAGAATMRAMTFRSRLADPKADPVRLLGKVTGVTDPAHDVGLFPVTEQALWSHLRITRTASMVALYPPDGLIEADYPLLASARVERDAVRQPLVDRLTAWFRTKTAAHALADLGFRPPAGAALSTAPAADGLLAHYGEVAPLPPDPDAIITVATAWSRYQSRKFQVLLLVDASASMNDQVRDGQGRLTTKAVLLRECASDAVRLFSEDTSVAMWLFPTPRANGTPYTEVVPFGSLRDPIGGVARRQVLGAALSDYQASPRAGAPLYETVLRGQAAMRERSQPGTVTLVFVLTDGRDAGSTSRAAFLARLTPDVPIFGLGYGIGADMTTLREAAKATGGQAIAASNPRDLDEAVATMFLAAHQRATG
jgi:Ca-activated chloride channel homolog